MAKLFRVAPLALALAGAPAGAQVEGGGLSAPSPSGVSIELGAEPGAREGQLSVDGVYTIKGGDTLWDLSQEFLSNPWYWPKIWADNPYIDNPHWIYPGNPLRIRQSGEGLPPEISAQPLGEDPVEAQEEGFLPTPQSEVAGFTMGTKDQADTLGQSADLVTFSGQGRYSMPAAADELRVRVSSIVTERELAQSGVVESSFEQKELLSTFDRLYARMAGDERPRVGETLSLFRTRDEVIHPRTKKRYGYHTELLGLMTVVAVEKDVVVGEVGAITDYIVRGDRVGPATALDKIVRPAPATRDVDAYILATDLPQLREVGESHVVFIDKGRRDGVEEGNLFSVLHSGDGLTRLSLDDVASDEEQGMPWEQVATLLVFDVREDSAAAMVVKSLREVKIGDRAQMKAAVTLSGTAELGR